MSEHKFDIVRAIRDKVYFESLTPAQKAMVPPNPVGEVELSDAQLEQAAGGTLAPEGGTTGSQAESLACACQVTVTGTGDGCFCKC